VASLGGAMQFGVFFLRQSEGEALQIRNPVLMKPQDRARLPPLSSRMMLPSCLNARPGCNLRLTNFLTKLLQKKAAFDASTN
jgi:hypothetical protein